MAGTGLGSLAATESFALFGGLFFVPFLRSISNDKRSSQRIFGQTRHQS